MYKLKVFLIVTGLWILFYFIFSLIFKLFTRSPWVVLYFFLFFVGINFLLFPAAYFYVYEGVMEASPLDFLFSLNGSEVFFIVFMFLIAGPFGFIINVKYLLDLLG